MKNYTKGIVGLLSRDLSTQQKAGLGNVVMIHRLGYF